MLDFLNGMDLLERAFWYVAMISSLVFAIQTVLTFAGGGDTDGLDADFDGDFSHADAPFQFFSFRNFINFMLGFGWAGVVFYKTIGNTFLLILTATAIGLLFVYLFFLIIRQILKLTEDNTFNIQHLVNHSGQVYIPIPGAMNGKGKVQISIKGSTHEIDAMTEGEGLPSGTMVMVQRIENKILIVQRIK